MALTFPPFDWHALAWISFVPWFWLLPKLTPNSAWLFGTCLGAVFYRISLSWMFGLSAPLAAIAVIAFSILVGLSFRVAKFLAMKLGTAALWCSLPFVFVGQEVLRSEGLNRFRLSYGALGYSQAANPWIAQFASIGGVFLLSFIIVSINAALAYAIVGKRPRSLIVLVAIGIVILLGGTVAQHPSQTNPAGIAVACVQAESQDERDYVELTRQAAESKEQPSIIVLPEHTIDGDADRPHPFIKQLSGIAKQFKVYIVVGAHVRAPVGLPCDYDNVALLLGPDGRTIGHQAKSVPVPFFNDGNPARSQRVFSEKVGCIGMCVCYDTDFSDIPRSAVALGAEILIVPVMNPQSWPRQQRLQQSAMAQIRSIETRRYAVRAASSGISQVVEPSGRIQASRDQTDGSGLLFGKIAMTSEATPFVRGGYFFATALGWNFLLIVILLTITGTRDTSKPHQK
jgi:apolipoprotein N-acyltransferase